MKILKVTDGKKLYKFEPEVKEINVFKEYLDEGKSCYYLFYGYTGTSVEDLISYSDTENVTNMSGMFNGCTKLQSIPLLDTSKVTNMYGMFNSCVSLQSIPLLDTNNVTNMNNMFAGCTNLQTIDITSMDKIASTSNTQYMCYNDRSLIKFIIRNMSVIPPLNTNSFNGCYHFLGTVNATYNPEGLKDGRIYIPDEWVEQVKQATNWSAYADIIVPLSTLEE